MTHHGSCHCGSIAFEVEGTIEQVLDCNCTMCRRRGGLLWFVPVASFKLLTPESSLSTYRFNKKHIQHRFCALCGIAPYGDGSDPKGSNPQGTLGDCYDRYVVRVKEVFDSLKILRQVVNMMKENEKLPVDHPDRLYQAKLPARLRIKRGEVYCRSENPRGETGYYVASDGTDKALRIKIRTGSFSALGCFELVTRGLLIGDVIAVIGSFDIVLPEVDR